MAVGLPTGPVTLVEQLEWLAECQRMAERLGQAMERARTDHRRRCQWLLAATPPARRRRVVQAFRKVGPVTPRLGGLADSLTSPR